MALPSHVFSFHRRPLPVIILGPYLSQCLLLGKLTHPLDLKYPESVGLAVSVPMCTTSHKGNVWTANLGRSSICVNTVASKSSEAFSPEVFSSLFIIYSLSIVVFLPVYKHVVKSFNLKKQKASLDHTFPFSFWFFLLLSKGKLFKVLSVCLSFLSLPILSWTSSS